MEHPTKKNSVLVVDDEKANLIALTHILSGDYTVFAAKNGVDAIEIAKEHSPDVILLDILMPDMNGYEVLSMLKSDAKTRETPVIFITGLTNSENEEQGLSLGAADYITKPFSSLIVKLRVRNQMQMLNQLETIKYLSTTDQLTNISNRRNFDYRLRLEWDHATRNKTPLSILLIDIDNFKKYNDTHGHLQGDSALITVAKTIEQSLSRSIDFVARWGGEEFVVLLPGTELQGALIVAETIRKNIESATVPVQVADASAEKITVSIGVNAGHPTPESLINSFVDGSDRALYEAKRTGKNKVCNII